MPVAGAVINLTEKVETVNVNAVNVAVVNGKTITESVELRVTQQGQPVRIQAVPNGKFILAEQTDKPVAPENITVKRVGKDLHVATEGTGLHQPQLIIEGFFDSQSQLIGVGENGGYYEYISSDTQQGQGAAFLKDGVSSSQVLGAEQLPGLGESLVAGAGIGLFWPAVLGLGVVGLALAAGGGGGGGGGGSGGGGVVVPPVIIRPPAPTVGSAEDNVGDLVGPIQRGGSTDDATPTFGGSGTPGNVVVIEDNGVAIGETVVDAAGNWEFTPVTPLPEGDHSIVVVERDQAGNTSDPSDPYIVIVDTIAPVKPGVGTGAIEHVIDDVGAITGPIANGGSTDDTTPTIGGSGVQPGDRVSIIDNGVKIGEVIADGNGDWTFTPNPVFAEGEHPLVIVVTDPVGNVSEPSDPYLVIVDTTAPGQPGAGTGGIETVIDNVGQLTGPIDNGGTTDDNTPTFGGSGAQPGDRLVIIDNGVEIGETIVDAGGNWEFTPNPPLVDGEHQVVVVITDPAGNTSAPSDPYIVIVDTSAPVQPVIASVVDDQGDITGPLAPGATTDDAMPALNGTAEANSSLILYDNGVEIGRVPVDAAGNWRFTPTAPLANGQHGITVIAVDAAGNASVPSAAFDFELLTGGTPPAPAITGVNDDVADGIGNIPPGGLTNDASPDVHGTAQPGSTVSVYADGILLGTTLADAITGVWSFTPTLALSDGLHNLVATATGAAGNVSPATGEYPITVDTVAPGSADSLQLTDDVGPNTGLISSGDTTDDSTPTLSGTAEPGSSVIVIDNGIEIGRALVDAMGAWTFTPAPALVDGPHSVTTRVADTAGNTGPASPAIDFTVDTRAVTISITQAEDNEGVHQGPLASGSVTDDSTPTLSGQATAGATVNIYLDGVLLQTGVRVNAAGLWTYTVAPALAEGSHAFTATAVTAASGESAPTADFTLDIDTTASAAPTIDDVDDDVGAIQGSIANGTSTDDTTPTLRGSGVEGDVVIIYDTGMEVGRVTVGAGGNWSFTPTAPLNDGSHEFTVVSQDPAGNQSAPSAGWTVIVDTTAPTTQAIIDSMGKDSGTNTADFITNDGSAGRLIQGTLTAALVAGEVAQVSVDGGVTWQAIVPSSDTAWSFVDQTRHAGDWSVQTRVVDAAGNANELSQLVTLDTVGPEVPPSVVIIDGTVTVSLAGTNAVAGDAVKVAWGDASVDHVLSTADIAAGSVDVVIPTGIVSAYPLVMSASAGIVDAQGNTSDHRHATFSRLVENFDTTAIQGFSNIGDTAESTFLLITQLTTPEFPGTAPGNGSGIIGGSAGPGIEGNVLAVNGQINVSLKGLQATTLTFNSLNNQTLHLIEFFDENGVEVANDLFGGGAFDDRVRVDSTFTMPNGLSFSSFRITTGDQAGNPPSPDWIQVDNIAIDGVTGAESILPPPAEQTVVINSGTYYGAGDDNTFNVADINYFTGANAGVHGGAGVDALVVRGAGQVLDLASVGDTLSSVEIIDLTGTGDNTLNISLDDVLALGETSLFIADDKVQMLIKGDADDVVNLDDQLADGTDLGDWTEMGLVLIEGVSYNVYQHSGLDAELLIQQGVTTNLV